MHNGRTGIILRRMGAFLLASLLAMDTLSLPVYAEPAQETETSGIIVEDLTGEEYTEYSDGPSVGEEDAAIEKEDGQSLSAGSEADPDGTAEKSGTEDADKTGEAEEPGEDPEDDADHDAEAEETGDELMAPSFPNRIILTQGDGYTITCDRESAASGEDVIVSVTPVNGYRITNIEILKGTDPVDYRTPFRARDSYGRLVERPAGGDEDYGTTRECQFEMPNGDVTVRAEAAEQTAVKNNPLLSMLNKCVNQGDNKRTVYGNQIYDVVGFDGAGAYPLAEEGAVTLLSEDAIGTCYYDDPEFVVWDWGRYQNGERISGDYHRADMDNDGYDSWVENSEYYPSDLFYYIMEGTHRKNMNQVELEALKPHELLGEGNDCGSDDKPFDRSGYDPARMKGATRSEGLFALSAAEALGLYQVPVDSWLRTPGRVSDEMLTTVTTDNTNREVTYPRRRAQYVTRGNTEGTPPYSEKGHYVYNDGMLKYVPCITVKTDQIAFVTGNRRKNHIGLSSASDASRTFITLHDPGLDGFKIDNVYYEDCEGRKLKIEYSGGKFATDHNSRFYISAVIYNSEGDSEFYGKLAPADGYGDVTIDLTLPAYSNIDLNAGDSLYLFLEDTYPGHYYYGTSDYSVYDAQYPYGVPGCCDTSSALRKVQFNPPGHDWQEPEYTLVEVDDEVVASRACNKCNRHEREEAPVDIQILDDGSWLYTAEFENEAFGTYTFTCSHDWRPVEYTWSEDNSTVTAKRVCRNNWAHVQTETADTVVSYPEGRNWTVSENRTYTAEFKNPAFQTQTKTIAPAMAVPSVRFAGRSWNMISYGGRQADGSTAQYTTPSGEQKELYPSDAIVLLSSGRVTDVGYYPELTDSNERYNEYASSGLRERLDSMISDPDQPIFTEREKSIIIPRTLEGGAIGLKENGEFELDKNKTAGETVEDALLWPLSYAEAESFGNAVGNRSKKITDYLYNAWLRTPSAYDENNGKRAYYVSGYNNRISDALYYCQYSLVPAFYMDKDAILFASAAAGGKASGEEGLDALTDWVPGDGDWKITIRDDGSFDDLDGHAGFGIVSAAVNDGIYTVEYFGAATGDREYISALIEDENGRILKYGRIKNCADREDSSGTVIFRADCEPGQVLYLFNEQCNDDYHEDYASNMIVVNADEESCVHCFDKGVCVICGEKAAVKEIMYYDPVSGTEKICDAYIPVTEKTVSIGGTAGAETRDREGNRYWYAVTEDVELTGRLKVRGDINLIIMDDVTLDAPYGIEVPQGSSLTIWGQPELRSVPGDEHVKTRGLGVINAQSSEHGAAIGGNKNGNCGLITINGGVINAAGNWGAGIGAGDVATPGVVVINDGYVTATGGNGSAGIGGGGYSDGCDVTVNGGYVIAKGSTYKTGQTTAAIGAGRPKTNNTEPRKSGNFTMNGGTVIAEAGGSGAQAIGVSLTDAESNTGRVVIDASCLVIAGDSADSAEPVEYRYRVRSARSPFVSFKKCYHKFSTDVDYEDKEYCLLCGRYIPAGEDGVIKLKFLWGDNGHTELYAKPGDVIPAPVFTDEAPEGKVFSRWSYNGALYAEGEEFTVGEPDVPGGRLAEITAVFEDAPEEHDFSGSGTQEDPWRISNARYWKELSDIVDGGFDTSGRYFVLTNDITVADMIGTSSDPFNGDFDGGGHTLTFNLDNAPSSAAPFRYVGSASIRNLTVAGSIGSTGTTAAGFAGRVDDACLITDCVSRIRISNSNTVHSYTALAGFVAYADPSATVTIERSAFTGSLSASQGAFIMGASEYSSGFIGMGKGTITDCLFAPAAIETKLNKAADFSMNSGSTVTDCYSVMEISGGSNKGIRAHIVSADDDTVISGSNGKGILFEGKVYAGDGDELSLTLDYSDTPAMPYNQTGFKADKGGTEVTLTASDEGYTLTMPDGDVTIGAKYAVSDTFPLITKKPAACTPLVYNGTEMTLIKPAEASAGTLLYAVTETEEEPDESSYSEIIPKKSDAGVYYVWYRAKLEETDEITRAAYIKVELEKRQYYGTVSAQKTYLYSTDSEDLIDISEMLPADCGKITFGRPVTDGDIEYVTSPVIMKSGKLYFNIKRTEGNAGKNGTITVSISTRNYKDLTASFSIRQIPLSIYETVNKGLSLCREKKLNTGKSVKLTAGFANGSVADRRVTWVSTEPEVATVTQDGKVTAMSAGQTTIEIVSEEKPDVLAQCRITVTDPVTAINFDKKSYAFGTGESTKLSASILPMNATGEIQWSTSDRNTVIVCDLKGNEYRGSLRGNEKIYEISDSHQVIIKAVGTGKAKVTVAATDGTGKKATCSFTVGKAVSNFEITGKGGADVLPVGKTLAMTCNWGDSKSKPQNTDVTWKAVMASDGSDASAVAVISDKGVLTGYSEGLVRVTATSVADPSKKATADISVYVPAKSASLSATSATLSQAVYDRVTVKLTADTVSAVSGLEATGETIGSAPSVTWTVDPQSPNSHLLHVEDGAVTLSVEGRERKAAGKTVPVIATVRAFNGFTKTLTCKITIAGSNNLKNIKLSAKNVTLGTGNRILLEEAMKPVFDPVNPDEGTDIIWSEDSEGQIVQIDENGYLIGVKEGEATITAETVGKVSIPDGEVSLKASCKVKVRNSVTGIAMSNAAELSANGLAVGKTFKIKTAIEPAKNSAGTSLVWSSSNEKVARVDQKGTVTAIATGTVTVTASSADLKAEGNAPAASVTFKTYIPVSKIEADKTKLTIGTSTGSRYGQVGISAVLPADATNSSIKWTADNNKVKLSAVGKNKTLSSAYYCYASDNAVITRSNYVLGIMGVKPGVTKLTGVTMDGTNKKVTCTVTVRGEVTKLSLKEAPKDKTGANDVTFTSRKGSVTYYSGTVKANGSLTIVPLSDINQVSATSADKADKALYGDYKKYTDISVSYRSTDTNVATVDSKGKVKISKTAASGDTATIIVTSAEGKYSAQLSLTVK